MALRIVNRQRSFPINISRLRTATECMRRAANVHDYDLSIRLTSDPPIRQLNAEHRNQPHATDVLSFPPQRVYPPRLPQPLAPGVKVLGDIVISVEYVARNGRELGVGLMQRVERLVAHSLCHLLGYDHETDGEWREMEERERQLLQAWTEEQRRQREERQQRAKPRRRRSKATAGETEARLPPQQPATAAVAAQSSG